MINISVDMGSAGIDGNFITNIPQNLTDAIAFNRCVYAEQLCSKYINENEIDANSVCAFEATLPVYDKSGNIIYVNSIWYALFYDNEKRLLIKSLANNM